MNLNDNNSNVFEMILNSRGDEPVEVSASPSARELSADWHKDHIEGQLAVDVLQTEKEIIVISTMAGALTEKIEVFIHNDLLTIKGSREFPIPNLVGAELSHAECFWGKFSRTIVLPADVKGDMSKAEYKNGILIIRVPKQVQGGKVPITILDE